MTHSNFRFSKLKKFVSRSVFGELQLTQMLLNFQTFCCNLKSREVWEQTCLWLFCYFDFERNYDVLKSKNPCILLNKNINFIKNETESKMENLTHSFREMNLLLQLVQELQINSKTVMSSSSRKKKNAFFVTFISSKGNFLTYVFYLNV